MSASEFEHPVIETGSYRFITFPKSARATTKVECFTMREAHNCSHRETDAAGSTVCGLLRSLTGVEEMEACRVGNDACIACCEHALPSAYQLNPVVASLLSRVAEQVIARGGRPGCDLFKARELKSWGDGQLAVVRTFERRAETDGNARAAGAAALVAVVIVCTHGDETVAEVIESLANQTSPAHEITVVDATSGGSIQREADRLKPAGVNYVRCARGDAFEPWRVGLVSTNSEIICFLTPSDLPAADYLEKGLGQFAASEVGIVYSDVHYVGERTGRTFVQAFSPHALERYCYIHSGSLVRRQALEISDALAGGNVCESKADWVVWRRVVRAGWQAVKQTALFHTRRHPEGEAPLTLECGSSHFERASLEEAAVTIFTALSGRFHLWSGFAAWLEAQTWPRAQCRLILMDTSADLDFGREVRKYLGTCDYPDVRHISQTVAQRGLADRPRMAHLGPVRLACARIYNRLAREVTTPFVLVVEDDIVPPDGVIRRLMHGIDPGTAAVSAPYRSRLHGGYVVWDDLSENLRGGSGVQAVGGAGFGCILLRREVLDGETFRYGGQESLDFDRAFCGRLRKARWTIKIDWSQQCEHLNHVPASAPECPHPADTE